MLFLVIVISCASTVMASCGTCDVNSITSSLDRLQAQAFNKMPEDWNAVPVPKNVRGFVVSKDGGFGPRVCAGDCLPNWWTGGQTTCTYKTKPYNITVNGHLRSGNKAVGICTKKYHDKYERLCRSIPHWNNYWKMWCHTWYSGKVSSWGKTHFPVCSVNNMMCQPY